MASLSYGFGKGDLFEITKNLDLFISIVKELNLLYVDDIDSDELVEEGVNAMLKSLDPYTSYYPAEDVEGYNMQVSGKYGGIGAIIRKIEDYVVVAEPYDGFPAFKAGLVAGDKIVEVEGVSVKGKGTDEVSKLLRGEPGTKVNITIEKPVTEERIFKTLTREEIKVEAVPYYGMVNPQVGYIRLTNFTNDCSRDVRNALNELKQNNDLQGVVLDLRSNPGGLLQEAVKVSNAFVAKGKKVVSTKGRYYNHEKSFLTEEPPVDPEIPLVVLINQNSASASEIVSGVIQDYDRGLVVGETSFGKGLVQTTMDLKYNAKLKMTTSKYFLPSGRCVQAIDYSGRYKDGAEKVPDSLRTKFKTDAGRLVYDAGGVRPDVEVEREKFSILTGSLYQQQLFFRFASDYHEKNGSIADANEFELSDQEYNDFVAWLGTQEFSYTSESEKLLGDLRGTAEEEAYLTTIDADIKALEASISAEKLKDLDKFRDQIKESLESEIVTQYYLQKGRIANGLRDDPAIHTSVQLLQNQSEYKRLLNQ